MAYTASITNLTLSGTAIESAKAGEGVGRVIIRVSQATRMSLHDNLLDVSYLTLPAGTFLVLDPPNLLAYEQLFFRLDDTGGAAGVVEVLRC